MTKAARIRALAAEGVPTAQIAEQVGVRYQHAYNVLKRCDLLGAFARSEQHPPLTQHVPSPKPSLTLSKLEAGGFRRVGTWVAKQDVLVLDPALPKERGVYAFVKDEVALYVGLATKGVFRRFRSYCRPGKTQRTSIRLNAALIASVAAGEVIDIYTVHPPDQTWNGLPICGDAGLELGLMEAFHLPWNIRGARG